MSAKKDSLEADIKIYVADKLKEEITKDPAIATNKDKQTELSETYAKEYKEKMMSDILKNISK